MQSFLILCLCYFIMSAQEKKLYQLYDKNGKKIEYSKLLENAKISEIILFGELHDASVAHWLQLELTHDLFEACGERLKLSMEMFESDDQISIDEYFMGFYSEKNFESEVKLWSNYQTDYKPILEFCKKNSITLIASNIPRKYANMIYKRNFAVLDSLTDEALLYLPPLPIEYNPELMCYKTINAHVGHSQLKTYLAESQASKDATMAHNILKRKDKNSIILHLQGTYHSDNYEAVYWYLKARDKSLKILTISTVYVQNADEFDQKSLNKADIILQIDNDATKSY